MVRDVAAHGSLRFSDNGLEVRELLSVNTVLTEPRARLMRSSSHPHVFNPGLAVARFFYLLSGSHDLDAIAFYSPAAARFTDDGLTMPGGAHGFRLFYPGSSTDQFEGVLNALNDHPERNRAVVSFYHPQDCGSATADLTCVMGAMFSCKEGRLEILVNMRANDAFRLLWHDMFEFSMLGEYIARLCGFELGAYYHSSFVMMLIGRSAYEAVEELTGETDEAPLMAPMPRVTTASRAQLVRIERRIRSLVGHQPFGEFTTLLKTLAQEVEPYWADLFTSVSVQGRMVRQDPATAAWELSQLAVPDGYVVSRETIQNSLKIARHRAAGPLISRPQ
ncbi:thymidylate synthase [Dactylosporangium sp. CA-092794]|uniref:thymidylate synthase n=1 Tax=Dactylosporangium sp. CA-092794 TaxID=3239929 RepID=UPI003D8DAAFF